MKKEPRLLTTILLLPIVISPIVIGAMVATDPQQRLWGA
jgi:ABC-type molybdate transport system permease subunit